MTEKTLAEMADEARKIYYANWRSNNKERIKQHNKNFWRKKAMQMAKDKAE